MNIAEGLVKRSGSLVALLLFFSFFIVSFSQIEVGMAESKTIVVPDDYVTIQEAINNADDGDTIFVKSGTYVETLIIGTSISLIGEDVTSTVIDGNNTAVRHVIEMATNNVKIIGFTIQKSGGVKYYERAGIYVGSSGGNNISGNIIMDNYGAGVRLEGSSHNFVSGNNITGNFLSGISIVNSSHNNTINGNTLTDNFSGIYVTDSDNQSIQDNLVRTSGNHGVYIDYSSNNLIFGNVVMDSYNFGLQLHRSSGNSIYKNALSNNVKGIQLGFSDNNTIFQNNMTHNEHGLDIGSSFNNLIFENIISNNDIGVLLTDMDAVNNTVWNNDFVGNIRQALDDTSGTKVFWDNGFEGNYWSDYNGTDQNGDGIGDSPYFVDKNNLDNYPLMEPVMIPEFPLWAPFLMMLIAFAGALIVYKRKSRKPNRL